MECIPRLTVSLQFFVPLPLIIQITLTVTLTGHVVRPSHPPHLGSRSDDTNVLVKQHGATKDIILFYMPFFAVV